MKYVKHALILIIVIILLSLIIYLIYRHYSKRENTNTFEQTTNNQVIIFKTHVWNPQIEKFVKKLISESVPYKIDFYILMHSDKYDLIDKIKDEKLKKYVVMYSEDEIKKTYKVGFFGMWLSNHWILMWFYKKTRHLNYKYYWSIEYDVRISGDSKKIWKYKGDEDFIYPVEPFKNPEWTWRGHYVGGPLKDHTKWYGYLQLTRYSRKFLEYMDEHYEAGENGQDEMMMFSLFKRGQKKIGLKGSNYLNKFIKDSWSVDASESDKHIKKYHKSESEKNKKLTIFHPVKY